MMKSQGMKTPSTKIKKLTNSKTIRKYAMKKISPTASPSTTIMIINIFQLI